MDSADTNTFANWMDGASTIDAPTTNQRPLRHDARTFDYTAENAAIEAAAAATGPGPALVSTAEYQPGAAVPDPPPEAFDPLRMQTRSQTAAEIATDNYFSKNFADNAGWQQASAGTSAGFIPNFQPAGLP